MPIIKFLNWVTRLCALFLVVCGCLMLCIGLHQADIYSVLFFGIALGLWLVV